MATPNNTHAFMGALGQFALGQLDEPAVRIGITPGELALAGQAVSLVAKLSADGYASLAVQGQTEALRDSLTAVHAQLAAQGQAITPRTTLAVAAASLALAGSNVSLRDFLPVSPAQIAAQGQADALRDNLAAAAASLVYAGQPVEALILTIEVTEQKLAIRGSGIDLAYARKPGGGGKDNAKDHSPEAEAKRRKEREADRERRETERKDAERKRQKQRERVAARVKAKKRELALLKAREERVHKEQEAAYAKLLEDELAALANLLSEIIARQEAEKSASDDEAIVLLLFDPPLPLRGPLAAVPADLLQDVSPMGDLGQAPGEAPKLTDEDLVLLLVA